jgi:hypothetical protein
MKELLNKPRVFLSHSKNDEAFIMKLRDDLMRCQIEPWVDAFEIRHGKPWLDAIFQSGIPTCDGIIAYITENSIDSPIVKKEIDASILQTLRDAHIAFLPYVSEEALRSKLRADIQALQVPVWNSANYWEILPCTVAEIWRSYLERTVEVATSREKIKRLELERVVEKREREGDVFSEAESKDFSFIRKAIDYSEPTGFAWTGNDGKTCTLKCTVNLLSLLMFCAYDRHTYRPHDVSRELIGNLEHDGMFGAPDEKRKVSQLAKIDMRAELDTYGLIEWMDVTDRTPVKFFTGGYEYVYTPKMSRFKYWLAYNNSYPKGIQYEIMGSEETA